MRGGGAVRGAGSLAARQSLRFIPPSLPPSLPPLSPCRPASQWHPLPVQEEQQDIREHHKRRKSAAFSHTSPAKLRQKYVYIIVGFNIIITLSHLLFQMCIRINNIQTLLTIFPSLERQLHSAVKTHVQRPITALGYISSDVSDIPAGQLRDSTNKPNPHRLRPKHELYSDNAKATGKAPYYYFVLFSQSGLSRDYRLH